MKAKAKKGSKKAAVKTNKAVAKATKATLITIKKGANIDGRRGLMGKMVEAVRKAAKGISRDDLAKKFPKDGRVKVSKNVQWGVRHGVFAEAAAK